MTRTCRLGKPPKLQNINFLANFLDAYLPYLPTLFVESRPKFEKNLRISPHFGWAKILLQLGHFFLSSNFKEYLQAFFTQPIFYHCAKADLSNLADKDVLDDKDGLGRPDQPCQQQWIPPIFVDIGTALSFCAIFLIHIAVPVGTGTYVSLITGFLDDWAKLYCFPFLLSLPSSHLCTYIVEGS